MRANYDIPTKEELDNIMSLSKATNYDLYIVIRTLWKTGRRFGELYGVQNKKTKEWFYGVSKVDIDFANCWMYTYILKKKKYKEPRKSLTFLDKETFDILKEYTQGMNLEDKVFRYRHYRTIQRHFKKIIETLNIPRNITLHSFRAYFVTFCRRYGMSYEDIAKLTGHAKKENLAIYDRMQILEIEETARRIVEII